MSLALLEAAGTAARPTPPAHPPMIFPEPPFEMKFLVTEAVAAQIAEWAARQLKADPHAGGSREQCQAWPEHHHGTPLTTRTSG